MEILEMAAKGEEAESAPAEGNDSASEKIETKEQDASWSAIPSVKTDEYSEPLFGFASIPNKYSERGVKVDRSRPFLVRAAAVVTLPPGEHRILLRALTGARLSVDGQSGRDDRATSSKRGRRGTGAGSGENSAYPDAPDALART